MAVAFDEGVVQHLSKVAQAVLYVSGRKGGAKREGQKVGGVAQLGSRFATPDGSFRGGGGRGEVVRPRGVRE